MKYCHLRQHGQTENIIFSEVRQTESQILYDIIYEWNLKNNTNESIYKTETDSQIEHKLMVTKGEWEWGGINQEYGINRYKLLYIKQISNNDLLYSTGNYIQDPLINYNGK